ncbi:hypothetical protein Cgig2_030284 [Carnegiea gigantea]|uniref:Uncharacterized protein n=1 Tax=Carnegiea gigantea TaxID=171969 RepID=A0A9Q1GX91_9CARY|nr:hypothetical protein Cgig2_030284 [Carnegiea gigantea]
MKSAAEKMPSAKSASPPPPPPPPRRSWSSSSVTRREIEKFWRKKRLVEEEHFLAAIKAAARLRAARLSQEDYLMFLEDIQEEAVVNKGSAGNTNHQEIRVGIKDWWTKSKYAYLNQPAVGSAGRSSGRANRRFNYVPNKFYLCNYEYSPATATVTVTPPTLSAQAQAQPQALPPCLGVF